MPINTNEIYKDKYKTFDCGNKQEIINHINKHHSIYLHGAYGLGKSHLVYYAARQYAGMGHHVIVKRANELHDDLINEIQHNKATGEIITSIKTKMRDTDILFIDDLGNEKMTDFVHEALEGVIDYRYRNNLATYITSNYDINGLYNKYADQIGEVKAGQLVSRIKTFGAIEIKGANWRNVGLPDL